MTGSALPLPFPYLPGTAKPDSFEDRVQQNFDAIAVAVGKPVQATALISWGTGSPNGAVVAAVGALFLRLDGGAGTTLYVKESGANTNTGWVGK
jgi:hypothetical protein